MNEPLNFPVADWEAIPLKTLKNVLTEVKERFSYDLEEVVSITDKAIKYQFGFLTFLFGAGIFISAHAPQSLWYFHCCFILQHIMSIEVTK